MSFFGELKRRNVFRVGVAYVVTAWLAIQVVETLFPVFELGNEPIRIVVIALAIGLLPVLFFTWAFELTPEGLKREKGVDRARSISTQSGKKLDRWVIVLLAVALAYFAFDKFILSPAREARLMESSAQIGEQVILDPTPEKSIAVLPFVNMSSDEQQEWFANGLTEELLNALARTADLLVAARTSSFKYKDSNEDIPTIARALGVKNVLEGSVRRSGDRLRVTAQLIRASDGFHLWSQNYDRNVSDIIDLQEELATSIAHALETAVDPEALATMVNAGTRSVEAYESYLRGLELQQKVWASVDRAQAADSLDAFEKAVELDPEFARAYLEISNSWALNWNWNQTTPAEEFASRIAAIDNAIAHEKDPVNKLGFRARRAEEELDFLTALQLNTEYLGNRPNSHEAQHRQLNLFRVLGRQDEGIEAVKAFYDRDGYDVGVTDVSLHLLRDGSDKEYAIDFARMVIQRFPDQPLLLNQVHRTLLAAGDIESARALPEIVQRLNPDNSRMAHMTMQQLCAEGRDEEAIDVFDTAIRNNTFPDERAHWLAYKILGRDDEAVELLTDLDNSANWKYLSTFLGYGFFDPRPYPYLMARLESKGVPQRKVTMLPYRCRKGLPATSNTGPAHLENLKPR